VPKIILVSDLTVEETPFRVSAKQRLHRALGIVRSSIRTADHIIAISRDTAIRLQYHYQIDPSCISVLYLAADQNFRPMQPNIVSCYLREISPSLAINNYVFCIDVGSMVPVVLQAFARALRQLGHDQLFLVLRENISRATRDLDRTVHELQIAHRVVWIKHHIPDPTLIALYNGALCLCYPSPYEGFGLPAMEAMSCGCPVIGAKAGALPEIVNEAGLLVNSSSAVEIAHAIVKVATDEHLRQYLRRRGLTRSSQFTYEHSAQQLKLLLRSIACRN
jgi:glycosyltransferase involved in cell wall biosynthesis